jgi:hypothetical protein
MVMGITYEGEIARAGAGRDPQQTVELICTDPRFVELASAKKPNFIIRLFNGALSFPRDWWYGATFIATRFSLLGAEGRSATDGTAHTMSNIIKTGIANPGFFKQTLKAVMGHLLHYPELYARQGTMLATGIAISILGAPLTVTLPVAVINFILATLGAIARAVDNGATTLAEIIIAAAIGESDPALSEHVARQLQMQDPKDSDYDISSEDEEYFIHVLEGVIDCLENPGRYIQNGERTRNRTVPVGRVSSSRPRGVMGSIPIGYETNGLDAISEELNNFGRNPDY